MKRKIATLMTMVMMAVTLLETYIPVCASEESEEAIIEETDETGGNEPEIVAEADESGSSDAESEDELSDEETVVAEENEETDSGCVAVAETEAEKEYPDGKAVEGAEAGDDEIFTDEYEQEDTDVPVDENANQDEETVVTEEAGGVVTLKSVSETAGSHAVRVIVTYEGGYNNDDLYLIASKESGVGSTADENGTVAALSAKETAYPKSVSKTEAYSIINSNWHDYTYIYGGLECSQKYYYRLATKANDDSYTFKTEEREFTTSAEVSSTAVTISDFEITSLGYGGVILEWNHNDPNDEIVFDCRLYYGDGEEDCKEIAYQYGKGGIYGKKQAYVKMRFATDTELKLTPAFQVYIGNELQWIKGETVTVNPRPLTDENVLINTSVGSSSFSLNVTIDPWYDADTSSALCIR